MDSAGLEEMIREDRAEWQALVAALEAQADEPASTNGLSSWTSRDVFAHLARWMEHSTDDLEARLRGEPPPSLEGNDDEINARWQQKDVHLSLGQAREWAHQAFDRRVRAIQSVPAHRWDRMLDAVARADGSQHYRAHRRYIAVAH
jgi:hypothetical protein